MFYKDLILQKSYGILTYKDKDGVKWKEDGYFQNDYILHGRGRRRQDDETII